MVILGIATLFAAQQPSSELTVYNDGLGFVKEVRPVQLKEGRQRLSIQDVASQIDPSSVSVRSLSTPLGFQVLEQNYEYDLMSKLAILNKSVGNRVRFVRTLANAKDVLEGVLVSPPTNIVSTPDGSTVQTYDNMVIRTDDGRIVLDPSGEVEVETIPEGLISRPTLAWELDSSDAGPNTLELSYITKGLSWSADYVMTIDPAGKADLQGWVTLNNTSGATYRDVHLKLLAGETHQSPAMFGVDLFRAAAPAARSPSPAVVEQKLFEYHLYTVQHPTTLRDRENKQVSLLDAAGIPFQKKIVFDWNSGPYYASAGGTDLYAAVGQFDFGGGGFRSTVSRSIHPKVQLVVMNDEASHLGMPLPKGRVRVYQKDSEGSEEFLGEDSIDHTPQGEKVTMSVGEAFDLVGDRKVAEHRRVTRKLEQDSIEIELRNRSNEDHPVTLLEHLGAGDRIVAQSMPWKRLDARSIEFAITLKAGEVKKITYTVESKLN